jgi:hypothetical protein
MFLVRSRAGYESHRAFTVSSLLGPGQRRRYVRAMCGRVRLSSDVSEIELIFATRA